MMITKTRVIAERMNMISTNERCPVSDCDDEETVEFVTAMTSSDTLVDCVVEMVSSEISRWIVLVVLVEAVERQSECERNRINRE